MDQRPLVSILINAYNEERYIGAAIDSALAQTYTNIEVVVLDDQSKDRTPEIVKGYTDPRVRYIRPDERLGLVDGRNALLAAAKGEFLTYLDADDIYEPSKVEREVSFLEEHKDHALVYCGLAYFYDGAPDVIYHHRHDRYGGDEVFAHLLERLFITNTAVMFRRAVYDALGGYRKDLGIVEDWEYFLRMAHAGYRMGYIEDDLVRYRLRWDSHTNFARQVEVKRSAVNIFEDLSARMTPAERERYDMPRHVARQKENLVIALFSNGEKKEALKIYKEIRSYVSAQRRALIMAMVPVPAPLLRFLIEKAWNRRKRRLFIPVK